MNYNKYSFRDLSNLIKRLGFSTSSMKIFEQSVYERVYRSLMRDDDLKRKIQEDTFLNSEHVRISIKKIKTSDFITGPITKQQILVVYALEIPKKEIPLHINTKQKIIYTVLKWRLELGL